MRKEQRREVKSKEECKSGSSDKCESKSERKKGRDRKKCEQEPALE